jgi:pectin methylesterase-like acyl-CoA thioesterase
MLTRPKLPLAVIVGALVATVLTVTAPSAGARVLRVGTYHGVGGQYTSIQAAVDAAKPGDWILIAPGDYKTSSFSAPKGAPNSPAGVLITKPRIHLRGMNRNTVVVDGTKPGSPRCSKSEEAQNFGPNAKKGTLGLNGIMVWKADNVWVQNLTVCNFLGGSGEAGNEVWWNDRRLGVHGLVPERDEHILQE